MKTKLYALALVLAALSATSCNKDDDNNNSVVIPTPVNTARDGFTWTENGGTTVKTAATATFSTTYHTLIAQDSSGATVYEINLNGNNAATYNVSPGNNAITYAGVNPYFAVDNGNVIITSNTGTKVSGTFQGTGSAAAGVTSVNGTFTNIDIIP